LADPETDQRLVEEVLKGNDQAFELLVWRWQRPLYNFLLRLTGDRERAQDISQEAFLRAYTRLKELREKEKFASWLFRIAVNARRSQLRTRSPEASDCQLSSSEQSKVAVGWTDGAQERRLAVRELVLQLPAEQREVLLLKVYHGFRFDEISSILDCPTSTVKSRLYRAFELIRSGWESRKPPAGS